MVQSDDESAKDPNYMTHHYPVSLLERAKQRNLPLDTLIAEALLVDILNRQYRPGEWIREQEVADRFGVSRSPVREALRQVGRFGFVVVRPWRGAQVIELSIEETHHIFDLLEVVYGVTARQGATYLTPEDCDTLEAILAPAFMATQGGSREAAIDASFNFGRFIARRGPSRAGYDLLVQIGRLALWQNKLLMAESIDYFEPAVGILRGLLVSLRAGDAQAAETLARASVAFGRKAILEKINSMSAASASETMSASRTN
jgi:GntR family transcriptional regulator, rspAB operon transcriptional repressor